MDELGFFESFFVWRDAMAVLLLAAVGLAYLGVWVVLKNATYVPLALSQVSSLGVVLAYLLGSWLDGHTHSEAGCGICLDPFWLSLAFTVLVAMWLARAHEGSNSAAVVSAYLVASALVLVLGGLVRQDLHDVKTVLFGNAVLVDPIQIAYVGVALVIVLAVHALWYRRFLFVSFDRDAANAAGLRPATTDALLNATIALMIAVATRAIGALPAFGLMVLPALAGLRLATRLRVAFAIAITRSMFAAALGYYASFRWSLPTGASIVCVAGVAYALAHIKRRR